MKFELKTDNEKLLTLKKANKIYALSKALNAGYSSSEDYIDDLERIVVIEEIEYPTKKTTKRIKKIPKRIKRANEEDELKTIHNIVILDDSSSMSGAKFDNAYNGLKLDAKSLSEEKGIDIKQSLISFTNDRVTTHFWRRDLTSSYPRLYPNNYTPLYSSIMEVLSKLNSDPNSDKVLIKIFTDGEDYGTSHAIKEHHVKRAILKAEDKGVTITFVATKKDMKRIINKLGLKESNTLIHDNTPEGIKKAFKVTEKATKRYTKKIIKGKGVKTGFYKGFSN